ncbi:MAG TPA: aminotransferase class III-fold pyridoxal phosphate-dependent enzyme, partial [Acidobacteriota bacterium]|nr:aminotransferase class III-fold pyridoxal phosphate-dependent enzyme [Acidobacteriota bacterium]
REIMDYVAPLGPVYQAGTLSGNPLAMTAGLTTLKLLQQPGVYDNLERLSNKLVQGLRHAADKAGFKTVINSVGSMFTLFFTSTPVTDWETAKTSDTQLFAKFFHAMLAEGVYFPPSQFEAAFFGLAHTNEIIDSTIAASERAFGKMKN